mgnify:FL=1
MFGLDQDSICILEWRKNADFLVCIFQEKLVSMDFGSLVEISLQDPPKPKLLTHTPFTFVNTASALVEVASKLLQEREIAVSSSMMDCLLI